MSNVELGGGNSTGVAWADSVRFGESIKKCLEIKGFERRGVHRIGWWAPFFCADDEPGGSACTHIRRISRQRGDSRVVFWDTAVNVAIRKLYRVLPNCLKMLLKFCDMSF